MPFTSLAAQIGRSSPIPQAAPCLPFDVNQCKSAPPVSTCTTSALGLSRATRNESFSGGPCFE
jgi:hypothetical protein